MVRAPLIRSSFAITRLLVLPYAALLALYLLAVGGGGAWLYLQVRAVEMRLPVDEIMALVEPLADKLNGVEVAVLMDGRESWPMAAADPRGRLGPAGGAGPEEAEAEGSWPTMWEPPALLAGLYVAGRVLQQADPAEHGIGPIAARPRQGRTETQSLEGGMD